MNALFDETYLSFLALILYLNFGYKTRAGIALFTLSLSKGSPLQAALSCENPPPHLGGFVMSKTSPHFPSESCPSPRYRRGEKGKKVLII